MSNNPLDDEFDRIIQDRQYKDYYAFARAVGVCARTLKEDYSNWIAEEFKHLRFYCNIIGPNTNGSTKDKIERQLSKMQELEKQSILLLISVDKFVKRIENRQSLDLSDLGALLSDYRQVIDPVEHLIINELVTIRTSLQDVLDTLRNEYPKADLH